ncbi:lipolytic protein G-D-S-L family [Stanieria cyanosphaera PCC 7437]|uniref:Lipolytic protein G-D-S-L family n=1 Tax=Stanieria cyanosphaera (strain ATCC 29371 / PCC 7437) TaxID=111780 RepID=K9Y077_STAC7|nr:GDSL-type esterase/lipase family protein [Stanieria cyanosphaera]AFZ37694.1 lipolytic protein G-D-S-L family [Stanieria cyanosphaera PCC 7437]
MHDIRICFLGESFVNGTGDSTHLGWTGRLCVNLSQKSYAVTYYNLGIRRETSTELARRWQSEIVRRLPIYSDNRLVFSFGTNDTTLENGHLRVELTQSITNARQILTTAKQKYPVLMISPPPILDNEQNQRTQILAQHFAALCQELQIPYLDVLTTLSKSSVWMAEVETGDGAHPNQAGYTELASLVQNWPAWLNWF